MSLIKQIEQLELQFSSLEPDIRAFVPEGGRFDRLRREAIGLEQAYPEPSQRPPLFGVFLGVKDIFHVRNFPTQAGSRLPAEKLAGQEGEVVSRLKAAGALIVGKTVTTEFAYFAPGPTRNPHNLDHTPGGSSSGSAAAAAAGLCDLALGTQTIGSVNRPAAFCGVVGYKPSYDRFSRKGVIPLSPSVDHVGLFARTVEVVERATKVISPDWSPYPSSTFPAPILGIPQGPYLTRVESEGRVHFDRVVDHLSASGFVVRSIPAMADFEEIFTRHNHLVAYEAAQVHAGWFAEFGELYHPKTRELIQRGQAVPKEDYEKHLAGRQKLRQELVSLMESEGIDLWLSPPAPGPAPKTLDNTGNPVMNLPWTHAGLPTLTLPAGKNENGLPLGLQLAAGWYADEKLLCWGGQISQTLVDF